MNVNTMKHYPFIKGPMPVLYPGMRYCYGTGSLDRMEMHMIFRVADKYGWKENLFQHGYLLFGHDLLDWIVGSGRLPATRSKVYFEELNKSKALEKEYKEYCTQMYACTDDKCSL